MVWHGKNNNIFQVSSYLAEAWALLAYLFRFAGPQATFMGSGHPKTIEKAFFTKYSLVNPVE